MKYSFSLIAVLFFLSQIADAQDFTFSQYAAMPYLINPAATGQVPSFLQKGHSTPTTYQHRLATSYRGQWDAHGSDNAMEGYALGWDMQFCNGRTENWYIGLGAYLQRDVAQPANFFNMTGRGMFSVTHRTLGNTWMSYGVSVGFLQYGVDFSKLTFDGQYNSTSGRFDLGPMFSGERALQSENITVADMDFGLHLHNAEQGWHIGGTLHHLLIPRYSFVRGARPNVNRLDMGFSLQGGLSLSDVLERNMPLIINVLYRKQSFGGNRQWQMLPGMGWKINHQYTLGAMCRISGRFGDERKATRGAFVPYAVVQQPRWSLRASWDIRTSQLVTNGGGPELSFAFYWGENKKCPRCPEF